MWIIQYVIGEGMSSQEEDTMLGHMWFVLGKLNKDSRRIITLSREEKDIQSSEAKTEAFSALCQENETWALVQGHPSPERGSLSLEQIALPSV